MTFWLGYVDPAEQATMLLDRVRVDAYARAIAATVRPGDVVVDLGTGSGVLAMLAARAGARRVYAVERTGAIALARALIAHNRLADVVVPVRADVEGLDDLPEAPRVIVAELLGHFAPAEDVHRLYRLARRWARPDAVTIPASYQLVFAAARPAALARELAAVADVAGLDLAPLADRLRPSISISFCMSLDSRSAALSARRAAISSRLMRRASSRRSRSRSSALIVAPNWAIPCPSPLSIPPAIRPLIARPFVDR